jgi:predicted lipid-binding transport protein (Tim44 family)
MMEVLNATLIGSPDADPLTYEVVSPHGLSTFSLVRAESSRPAVVSTAVPTATPVPAPAPEGITGGMSGYLVIFGTFVLGAFAGVIALVMLLWVRSR